MLLLPRRFPPPFLRYRARRPLLQERRRWWRRGRGGYARAWPPFSNRRSVARRGLQAGRMFTQLLSAAARDPRSRDSRHGTDAPNIRGENKINTTLLILRVGFLGLKNPPPKPAALCLARCVGFGVTRQGTAWYQALCLFGNRVFDIRRLPATPSSHQLPMAIKQRRKPPRLSSFVSHGIAGCVFKLPFPKRVDCRQIRP